MPASEGDLAPFQHARQGRKGRNVGWREPRGGADTAFRGCAPHLASVEQFPGRSWPHVACWVVIVHRSRSSCRERRRLWSEPVDPAQYVGEQRSWHRHLSELKHDVAPVTHDKPDPTQPAGGQVLQRPRPRRAGTWFLWTCRSNLRDRDRPDHLGDHMGTHRGVKRVGVVGDGAEGNLGGLYQAPLVSNNVIGTVNRLLGDVSAPFSVPVLPVRNLEKGEFWVFAGSGRLLVSSDLEEDYQGAYYGVKVSQDSGANFETNVGLADLYNVSGHSLYEKEIFEDLIVRDTAGVQLSLEDFQRDRIDVEKGWYRTFSRSNESNFVPTSLFRSALLINSYTPGISDCEPLGKSYLYALNAFNGLPDASLRNLPRSTTDTATIGDDTYEKVGDTYGDADGVAMNVTLTDSDSGFIPTSPGGLDGYEYDVQPTPGARRSWTEIPLDIVQ